MDLALASGRLDYWNLTEELSSAQIEKWRVYDIVRGVSRERLISVLSMGFSSCSLAGVKPDQINPDLLRKSLIMLMKQDKKINARAGLIAREIQKRRDFVKRYNHVRSG